MSRTHDDSKYRANIASRGNKMKMTTLTTMIGLIVIKHDAGQILRVI